jgi:hypothetical protein
MRRGIMWLVTVTLTLGIPTLSMAKTAGEVTVGDWRTMDESTRRGMVMGHMALSDVSEITCARPATVGEYVAALTYRQFSLTERFAEAMLMLQSEHGCGPKVVKPNA